MRTREINRRLSQQHEITALVAGYPGAQTRVEDGIRWIPIGLQRGALPDRLSYFALLGPHIRRHAFDLLVEDFGAPFSVGFAPWFTRQPVVASVQWLFAAQMREKYGLPFDWVERSGLRFYRDFIVVSEWLAETVRARRPQSRIETIHNGVEDLAFTVEPAEPRHFVYLGRLDNEQKGCDLLLQAYALARAAVGAALPPLLIVGDGPDQPKLEQQAADLGLAGSVAFCGRINGIEKYRLMASAYAVLMPSRFETFGMVAVEAQAAGAPVVTFDVGPLRQVAGPGGARLVPPFDVQAFAQEIVQLYEQPDLVAQLRAAGRAWAKRYNWDEIARTQEQHYLKAVEQQRAAGLSNQ